MTSRSLAFLRPRHANVLLLAFVVVACGESGNTVVINCGPGTKPTDDGCVLAGGSSSGGSSSSDETKDDVGTGGTSTGGASQGGASPGGTETGGANAGGTSTGGANPGETGGAGGGPAVTACRSIAIIGGTTSSSSMEDHEAWGNWLEAHSEATVHYFDPGHPMDPQSKPTLDADFLDRFDVIVLQLQSDSTDGPFWTYEDAEKQALKDWVTSGGALISLSGYNGLQAAAETSASNQLLSFVSNLSLGTDSILGGDTAPNAYCYGNLATVTQWENTAVATGVTAVGAFYGYPVSGGTPVAWDSIGNVVGAFDEVGEGIVFAWGDEIVSLPEQWNATNPDDSQYTDPNNPCYDKRPEQVFQHQKFWANVFTLLTADSECPITIQD